MQVLFSAVEGYFVHGQSGLHNIALNCNVLWTLLLRTPSPKKFK